MKTKTIKIDKYSDIQELAQLACAAQGEVTISKGKYKIDGKSVMGILSIDISQGAIIEYPETAAKLDEFLKQFETNDF